MESETDGKATTRFERQRLRTRRLLLDAGRTLIAAKGVASLRIQDITEEADVALGSFYNYFESKEELLEAVITESLSDLTSAIITNVDDDTDPAAVVALANLRVIRLAYDEPDFARLIVNIGHSEALFGDAVQPYARIAVERGIESGRFVVADIEVLLTAVIGGAFALIREILKGRHGANAHQAFARHVLASLGLPPHEAESIVSAADSRDQTGGQTSLQP
ncbi:TetR family transcriptional regulator [Mycobacterium kiyosense]|uniref:TetR family transcriptional regulator n=1 Tax=Mycobacterium kiyosense TaxID=2871094 RepID=A0A9P3USV7_9MYCO|nr:TetR/AcrR family transcriptional regulator [Mycobacterium kiyosense]BDB44024.1 TetR family transcriptional regulator [Mycobacterium kiyosense]GLB81011.1 TetR family transcriptional regulator [Mycobacterium kiyosense]GLB87229.1 TetR family transcriptional regulator [Mycobacterium kiyosense]GLB93491.1 TetR family transcriptional regulator [Mycobacterium kiyosense]GLB99721.1 TetR family transcriptional regulator [Mycobacterium kiyosense]